jgi:terminase large subunit-like protein
LIVCRIQDVAYPHVAAGARLYGSTNPDQPIHWLKTDYIDKKELIHKGDLFHLHMTMDENPNLPVDYLASQKLTLALSDTLGKWRMMPSSILTTRSLPSTGTTSPRSI